MKVCDVCGATKYIEEFTSPFYINDGWTYDLCGKCVVGLRDAYRQVFEQACKTAHSPEQASGETSAATAGEV